MSQKPLTQLRVWLILPRSKNHVMTHSKGVRVDRPCGFGCTLIGVDAYIAEVMAEARLHKMAGGPSQRLARRTEDFMHNRRHERNLFLMTDRFFLENSVIAFALFACARQAAGSSAGTLALK